MEKTEKTILLVDDDVAFLYYVEEAMQDAGYRVITKTDGKAALSVLDEGTAVDLVITDYMMPGMDGLKLISALRNRTLSIPVILLSAHGNIESYFRALNLGAYEFVSKPVKMRELNVIVKSALSGTSPNVRKAVPVQADSV